MKRTVIGLALVTMQPIAMADISGGRFKDGELIAFGCWISESL